MTDDAAVFEPAEEFPNRQAAARYAALVGLDAVKARLLKEAQLLLDPAALEQWSKRHHGTVLPAVAGFAERMPLFVFAGDVGTGKTALAESFGDALAREEKLSVTLMPMSLTAAADDLACGLLDGGDGPLGYRHALLHEAASAALEPPRRRHLHEASPTRFSTPVERHPGEIARHLHHSGHDQRAVEYLARASIAARDLAALPELPTSPSTRSAGGPTRHGRLVNIVRRWCLRRCVGARRRRAWRGR